MKITKYSIQVQEKEENVRGVVDYSLGVCEELMMEDEEMIIKNDLIKQMKNYWDGKYRDHFESKSTDIM